MRRRRFGWVLRGALLVATFAVAVGAFAAGVGTSAREGVGGGELLPQLYYALGLFVLGGLDLGVPTGGPFGWRVALWVAYFLGPVITTSAVVEGVLRLIQPTWLDRRGLRGHVVIVGLGQLGMEFLELTRGRSRQARVVMVDRQNRPANAEVAERRFGARLMVGDVRTGAMLDSLRLSRAKVVFLLTDDDLVNLECAWSIAEREPSLRIIAHVGDIALRRAMSRVAPRLEGRVEILNSHMVAAEHMYREHLVKDFAATEPEDVVVIAGFGRFGQTILEYLEREAGAELKRAVVVDTAAHRLLRLFRAQVNGASRHEVVGVEGDLDADETWEAVYAATRDCDVAAIYVLATDDTRLNLRAAVSLRSLQPEARIFVRVEQGSAFTSRLAEEFSLTLLSTQATLRDALTERFETWL